MKILCSFLFTLALASYATGQTPLEIVEKHEAAKAAELEAWIEANPDSEQLSMAKDALLASYSAQQQPEKMAPLLREQFDQVISSPNPDPQQVLMGMLQPLMQVYGETGQMDEAKAVLAKTGEAFSSHPMSQQISAILQQMEAQLAAPQVGQTMDIQFEATDGTTVNLADMKGKVILVDFWATWCGPCVAEMPNVIAAHEKYNEKGFEVIGISLDQDRAALDQFVSQHGMNWKQYFDGKGWQNDIAGQFGIGSIPATFLIGKDGKIVAKDLRGAALEQAVAAELGDAG